MRLTNHIARRFLTDPTIIDEICEQKCPGGLTVIGRLLKQKKITEDKIDKGLVDMRRDVVFDLASENEKLLVEQTVSLFSLVCPGDSRTYWVTDSIHDKLDMLKIKPDKEGHFDWRFFKEVKDCKKTFILNPTKEWTGGGVIRLMKEGNLMQFCHISHRIIDLKANKGEALWTLFNVRVDDNKHCSEFYKDKPIQTIYPFLYRLMCFLFLSENEEEILPANSSKGTRKSGKFKNDLPFPIIFLSSKWNVTSVRTEGFDVSGHFRIQPYKTGVRVILIQPFKKHGYVRKAKNLTENDTNIK